MKTYFCVTSAFYNDGRVTAAITESKEAEQKPESTNKSLRDRDIYSDWFESNQEAEKCIEDCKNA